jgi:hypothetical protein
MATSTSSAAGEQGAAEAELFVRDGTSVVLTGIETAGEALAKRRLARACARPEKFGCQGREGDYRPLAPIDALRNPGPLTGVSSV